MRASRRVARLQEQRQAAAESRAPVASAAVGYIRVSTEEQVQGFGLEAQERAIRAFAESQGYELLEIIADPAVSGATRPAERPGFSRVLALAEQGQFSILLVWKFDRLARQIVYAVTAVNDLAERLHVAIRSVTEPVDTATPMGRTIFAVLAGMAEQERHAITERTWNGRRIKATHGGYAGGATPYGYQRDREGGLVVDEAEAEVVRWIFALHASHIAHAEIARRLNAEGYRTRRGRAWRHGMIGYMLDNPKYRGDVEYLFRWAGDATHVRRPGSHAAIVSADG